MWVMTPRGFFSVVEKHHDREGGWLTIRAREKKDLDNLADLLPDATPFQENFFTDYPWRFRVKKEQWADAIHQMAMEIDYANFKDRVGMTDKKRAGIYGRIWAVLLDVENRPWTSVKSSYDWGDDAGTSATTGGTGSVYARDRLRDAGIDEDTGQLRLPPASGKRGNPRKANTRRGKGRRS